MATTSQREKPKRSISSWWTSGKNPISASSPGRAMCLADNQQRLWWIILLLQNNYFTQT